MATTMTSARLLIQTQSRFTNALDLSSVVDNLDRSFYTDFTNGTGANKAQVSWHDERSLATATSEDLDLAGALASAFGTATFTKVKAIAIQVVTATAGYRLEVGGAAANGLVTPFGAADDVVKIGAGGYFVLSSPVDGYVVTAGTGDLLKINNPSGGTITYRIWILGEGSVA